MRASTTLLLASLVPTLLQASPVFLPLNANSLASSTFNERGLFGADAGVGASVGADVGIGFGKFGAGGGAEVDASAGTKTGVGAHAGVGLGLGGFSGVGAHVGGSASAGGSWPSSSFQCNFSGHDGWSVDAQGKGCPYGDIGLKWFGSSIGWAPPAGWKCPSTTWSAPAALLPKLKLCTWWAPSAGWTVPSGFSAPDFWGNLGFHAGGSASIGSSLGVSVGGVASVGVGVSWPSATFQPSFSGKDGFSINFYGKGCPWGDIGFKWFGSSIGWAPPAGWKCPSTTWSPPSALLPKLKLCTWWAPSAGWIVPTGFSAPAFWGDLGFHASSTVSSGVSVGVGSSVKSGKCPLDYKCDKTGKDGFDLDFYGNGPLKAGCDSSWKFFGDAGWQPIAGWTCGLDWTPPSFWLGTCTKATWWAPPTGWKVAAGLSVPSFWHDKFGFRASTGVGAGGSVSIGAGVSIAWPSSSFQCNFGGKDGYSVDAQGKGCPYGNIGFKWFGSTIGWAPPTGWKCPSKTYSFPSAVLPKLKECTWWAPTSGWKPPHGFVQPTHWKGMGYDCGCETSSSTVKASVPAKSPSKAPSPSHSSPVVVATSKPSATKSIPATKPSVPAKSPSSPAKSHPAASTSTSPCTDKETKPVATKSSPATKPSVPAKSPSASAKLPPASATTSPCTESPKETKPATTHKVKPTPSAPAATKAPSTVKVPTTATDSAVTTITSSKSSYDQWPDKSWNCNGSGKDGKTHDWEGKTAPSGCAGWLWFGIDFGWQPPFGLEISDSFSPPSFWWKTCSKATWFVASSSWEYPVGFPIPSFWISSGFHSTKWPSSTFTCNKSGSDGWHYDSKGASRPSQYPDGFLWFGESEGWQPCSSFRIPHKDWTPPSGWKPQLAVWWKVETDWNVPSGFSCPNWWNAGYLKGSFSWLSEFDFSFSVGF